VWTRASSETTTTTTTTEMTTTRLSYALCRSYEVKKKLVKLDQGFDVRFRYTAPAQIASYFPQPSAYLHVLPSLPKSKCLRWIQSFSFPIFWLSPSSCVVLINIARHQHAFFNNEKQQEENEMAIPEKLARKRSNTSHCVARKAQRCPVPSKRNPQIAISGAHFYLERDKSLIVSDVCWSENWVSRLAFGSIGLLQKSTRFDSISAKFLY